MRMQLAVELDDAGRDEFYRWVEAVAVAVNLGQPQLTLGQGVHSRGLGLMLASTVA
jgi:hypothetical protein